MTIFPDDQVAAQLCTQFQQSGFKSTYLVCSFYPPTVKQIISIMKFPNLPSCWPTVIFPKLSRPRGRHLSFCRLLKTVWILLKLAPTNCGKHVRKLCNLKIQNVFRWKANCHRATLPSPTKHSPLAEYAQIYMPLRYLSSYWLCTLI